MIQFGGGYDNLRSVGLKHVDFFLAHLVRNRKHASVTSGGRRHSKTQACIPGCALDNRTAGFKQTGFFGPVYHIDRHSIFNRARRIKVFHFRVNGCHVWFYNIIEAHERRTAYEVNDAID